MKNHIVFILLLMITANAYADSTHPIGIRLDGTVGNAGKIGLQGPDYELRSELGKQVGPNLVHSFEQFNIHAGESATFSGPASVKNVISRVTGGSPSWLDGKISSTIPNVSLHFLNPSGVMFGPNYSTLDINGTFNINTERYMNMSDAELLGSDVSEDPYPRGIILDGTIGNSGKISLPGPDYDIISEYGRQAGANLFHSFEQFNILSGESAAFSGDDSVRYIISRVTGGSPSWINGKIFSTIPNADMYFLNPSGILFGQYAALGINSSFHFSTADYLRMGEQGRFYALPMANEILSVSAPASFGFLSDRPAAISSDRANLEVSEGKEISLTGGDIRILKSTLSVPKGKANIEADGNIDMSDSEIQLEGGGSIVIRGGSFYADNTQFRIKASDDNSLFDIDADNISMTRSWLNTTPAISGKGGDILLNAEKSASFSQTHIYTYTEGGMKNAGNLQISADRISLEKSDIRTATSGMGNGGEILLDARNSVSCFATNMIADTDSKTQIAGNAGNIRIKAGDISFKDSSLSSSTSSAGSGGNITLDAEDSLALSKSSIASTALGDNQNPGDSGDISLKAENMAFTDGSQINTSTYSSGHGGDVTVTALETVSISGSGTGIYTITSGYKTDEAGTGGNITVIAKNLNLYDKAQITASSTLGGKAGNIMLQIGSLTMDNESSITSDSPFANVYDFAGIQDRDNRMLIAGDRIVIGNAYNGKSSNVIYTGKTYLSCKTYYVRNIAELNRLTDQNNVTFGEIAEVGDAGNGKPGHFVYTDPSMGGWIRFGETQISEVADQSELSKINYQLYSDIGQASYASGDLIRVRDTGNGKSGLYVYAMIQYDWGAFSNIIRLGHFYVGNADELSHLTGQYAVSDQDMVSVADSKSEFVFSQNRWIKLTDNVHSISEWKEFEKFIPAAVGNSAEVRDGGDGMPKSFVYSGTGWVTLNKTYSVADLSERDALSPQTGDVVYAADDGTGKSAHFLYDNGQWVLFPKSDSGTIEIRADSIAMKNKSEISSSTNGNGDASDILLNVKNFQADSESSVSSESSSRYFGGDSGKITVTADESVKLFGNSSLTTDAADAGGGKISVHAGDTIYLNNSDISSSVKQGIGKGGDIELSAECKVQSEKCGTGGVILNQGNITANAQDGDGGAVFIRSENFLKSAASVVEASSARGNQGTVRIDAPDTDIAGNLTLIPPNYLDIGKWIYDSCESRSGQKHSTFTIRRYVVPPDPLGDSGF